MRDSAQKAIEFLTAMGEQPQDAKEVRIYNLTAIANTLSNALLLSAAFLT